MFHLKKCDNIFNLATQSMFFIHQTILNQLQFTATVILKKTIIVGKIANKFIRQCPMNFQNFKILQPSNKNNNDTHLQWKTKSNLTCVNINSFLFKILFSYRSFVIYISISANNDESCEMIGITRN